MKEAARSPGPGTAAAEPSNGTFNFDPGDKIVSRAWRCRAAGMKGLAGYLTTVGAKSGQKRQSTVTRFEDGDDAWLVVASAGGAAHHPAWYHNIAAHPDQVWIEFAGKELRVNAAQLDGDARAHAWQRITESQPRRIAAAAAAPRPALVPEGGPCAQCRR